MLVESLTAAERDRVSLHFAFAADNMARRPTRPESPHHSRGSSASLYYDRYIAKQLERTSSRKRNSSPDISAIVSSDKNTAKAARKKPRARRPRPTAPVLSYQNVICYFDQDSGLVAQETVQETSICPDIKRRKCNPRPEDDLVVLYYLLDPVSLREVTMRTRKWYAGLVVDKAGYRWKEDMKGIRTTEACKTQRMCVTHMNLAKTVTTPVIIVDTKKLVVLVLLAEKKKILVRWHNQNVLLSQWDSFSMNDTDEFQIQNLSNCRTAQIQLAEWYN